MAIELFYLCIDIGLVWGLVLIGHGMCLGVGFDWTWVTFVFIRHGSNLGLVFIGHGSCLGDVFLLDMSLVWVLILIGHGSCLGVDFDWTWASFEFLFCPADLATLPGIFHHPFTCRERTRRAEARYY